MLDQILSTTFSKTTKTLLISAVIASQSAIAVAEQKVPSHTYFQARKIVMGEFPQATNLEIERYQSESISGIVGKVLNASTIIKFELNGENQQVVMLPDGQHLLLGSIVKAGGSKAANTLPIATASLPVTGAMDAQAALDKIEQDHKQQKATGQLPKLNVDFSNGLDDLVKDSRLKTSDLSPVFEGAAKTPEDFMRVTEQLPAIQTGRGDKHIYVFFDPNCPNCRNEYQSSEKYADNAVFHWIPIYALTSKPTYKQVALSQSLNTNNAHNLDLLMRNPDQKEGLTFDVNEEAARRLQVTQKAFYNLADRRTPVTLYRDSKGIPVRITGYNPKLISSILKDMNSAD